MVGSLSSSMTSYSDIATVIINISVDVVILRLFFTFECEYGGQFVLLYDIILGHARLQDQQRTPLHPREKMIQGLSHHVTTT